MISSCDDCNCQNGIITMYYDESNEVLETYKCKECEWIEKNFDKVDCYELYYDKQGNIINKLSKQQGVKQWKH